MKKIAIIGAGPSGLIFALNALQSSLRTKKPIKLTLFEGRDAYTRTQVIRLRDQEWSDINDAYQYALDQFERFRNHGRDIKKAHDRLKQSWTERYQQGQITRDQNHVEIKLRDCEGFLRDLLSAYDSLIQMEPDLQDSSVHIYEQSRVIGAQSGQGPDGQALITYSHPSTFTDRAYTARSTLAADWIIDTSGARSPLPGTMSQSALQGKVDSTQLYPYHCAVTFQPQSPLTPEQKQAIVNRFIIDPNINTQTGNQDQREQASINQGILNSLNWDLDRAPRIRAFTVEDKIYFGQELPEPLYLSALSAYQDLTDDSRDQHGMPKSPRPAIREAYFQKLLSIQQWSEAMLNMSGIDIPLIPVDPKAETAWMADASLFAFSDLRMCTNPVQQMGQGYVIMGGDSMIQPHYQTASGVNFAIKQGREFYRALTDVLSGRSESLAMQQLDNLLLKQRSEYQGLVNLFVRTGRIANDSERAEFARHAPQSQLFEDTSNRPPSP